jgi:hypothetical protein
MQSESAQGNESHLRHKHPIYYDRHYADSDDQVFSAHMRVRPTNLQKSRVVEKYYSYLCDPDCKKPHQATAKFVFGSKWQQRKGYITKYLKAIGKVYGKLLKLKAPGARRNGPTRKSDYPDCEDELYVRFLSRRTVRGFPCTHYWLISEFHRVLEEAKPPGYDPKFYSNGWSLGFCVRYSITSQAPNNIKARDQVARAEAIRAFHKFLHLELQPSGIQSDPVYGRFGPTNMLHVDQVPLPFAAPHTKTLNPRGAKSCRIAGTHTSGLEKRQATLQLWICANSARHISKLRS